MKNLPIVETEASHQPSQYYYYISYRAVSAVSWLLWMSWKVMELVVVAADVQRLSFLP